MKTKLPVNPTYLTENLPVWFSHTGPQADLVISTRVRLARNLSNFRFPHHAGRLERKKIFDTVVAALKREKELRSFSFVNCSSLSPLEAELLLEERLISPDLLSAEGDRGVAVNSGRTSSIMINEEDHLRLHSIDSGFRAEEVWSRINRLDDLVGRHLPYAYEPRRGFLTSCPTNSGTGLRVSFLLHLPGLVLTKTIDPVLLGASQMGISTRGFFGEHSEVVGNLFQLSNQATLGACEEEFLQHTCTIIKEVVTHEQTARARILADAGMELTDRIFRAWGILLHARMLTMTEFLNLSSALRFGIDSGLFREMTIEYLNQITLAVMPAHLQKRCGKTLSGELRHVERADVVRELVSLARPKRTAARTGRNGSSEKKSTGNNKN